MLQHLSPRLAAVAALLAAACLATPTLAGQIKVKRGDDLQAAIDGASDGDTIVVRKGTYAPITLGGRSGLQIRGVGHPVIDGQGSSIPLTLQSCDHLSISGLVLRNSSGSGLYADGCSDVSVTHCTVEDTGDEGIQFENGTAIHIERNVIRRVDDDGIAMSDGSGSQTNDSFVVKNRISYAPDAGIDVNGNRNEITKNKITHSEGQGIYIASGTGNTVSGNRILKQGGDAVVLEEGTNTVTKNRIVKPTENGVLVVGGAQEITGNVVTKAMLDGIDLRSGGNTVTGNKVKHSGQFDLQDEVNDGSNTFQGNKGVKTVDPPDLSNPK
jgi:parallel beta-helix repeat protein